NKFVAGFIGEPQMNFLRGTLVRKDGNLRFLENDPQDQPALGGLALGLNAEFSRLLESRVNQPVWLGIRPEHLQAQPNGDAALGRLGVEFIEHLGAESWVHLKSKVHSLTLRCDPGAAPAGKGDLAVGVDPAGLCFFDGKTEQAIPLHA
ncbi:MAG TPA: hypothetical protein VLD18_07025, partial [Verrucomicrobiae bacterium]|nr:hypothetical protein [Verrucomicrobiae bacterium]